VRTQIEQIDQTIFQERLFAKLSSFFGLLALTLTSVGLYGIMAYAVTRRTSEIGIRLALGAERRQVLWMVLRESLTVSLAGLVVGLPLAFAGARLLRSMLFGLKSTDLLTFGGALASAVVVTLAASLVPARRAAQVDPMVALRYE